MVEDSYYPFIFLASLSLMSRIFEKYVKNWHSYCFERFIVKEHNGFKSKSSIVTNLFCLSNSIAKSQNKRKNDSQKSLISLTIHYFRTTILPSMRSYVNAGLCTIFEGSNLGPFLINYSPY